MKSGSMVNLLFFKQLIDASINSTKLCDKIFVDVNDILHIKTPGGGGYGLI